MAVLRYMCTTCPDVLQVRTARAVIGRKPVY